MNWDAIGALAELLGATAVVISLVYLAVQIRQSGRVSAAAAFQGIIDGITEHFRFMYAPENADVVAKGLADFRSLSATERMQFEALVAGMLNQVEASLITLHAQMMSGDTMENWAWWLRTRLFCYEGFRDWWSDAKQGYAPEVAEWINQQVALADTSLDFYGLKEGS